MAVNFVRQYPFNGFVLHLFSVLCSISSVRSFIAYSVQFLLLFFCGEQLLQIPMLHANKMCDTMYPVPKYHEKKRWLVVTGVWHWKLLRKTVGAWHRFNWVLSNDNTVCVLYASKQCVLKLWAKMTNVVCIVTGYFHVIEIGICLWIWLGLDVVIVLYSVINCSVSNVCETVDRSGTWLVQIKRRPAILWWVISSLRKKSFQSQSQM